MSASKPQYTADGLEIQDHVSICHFPDESNVLIADKTYLEACYAGDEGTHGIRVALASSTWYTEANLPLGEAMTLRDKLTVAIGDYTRQHLKSVQGQPEAHPIRVASRPAPQPEVQRVVFVSKPAPDPEVQRPLIVEATSPFTAKASASPSPYEVAARDMAAIVLDDPDFPDGYDVLPQDKPECVLIYCKGQRGDVLQRSAKVRTALASEGVSLLAEYEFSPNPKPGTSLGFRPSSWAALVPTSYAAEYLTKIVKYALDPKARVDEAFARPQQRNPIRKPLGDC